MYVACNTIQYKAMYITVYIYAIVALWQPFCRRKSSKKQERQEGIFFVVVIIKINNISYNNTIFALPPLPSMEHLPAGKVELIWK